MGDGAARRAARGGWVDAVRLSVGTLTVLPTPVPRTVDARSAGRSLALAPLTALVLGGLVALTLQACDAAGLAALPSAAVAVTVLALLCRGMHLDGLADTVDALGSDKPREQALDVMRRSDVGAFGALAITAAVLLQVAAIAQLTAAGRGPGAAVVAVVVSRCALPLLARRGIPSARSDGLGAGVVGTVQAGHLATALALTYAVVIGGGALVDGGAYALQAAGAALVGLVAAVLLAARCIARFGGVTGDVLGAATEVTLTVTLLVLALDPS